VTARQASLIDYRQPDIWEQVADFLGRCAEPRPTTMCGLTEADPFWQWRRRLEDYDLFLVTKGRGQVSVNGMATALQPGAIFLFRPGDTVYGTPDPRNPIAVAYTHFDFYRPGTDALATIDIRRLPARFALSGDFSQLEFLITEVVRLMTKGKGIAALQARLRLTDALIEVYRDDAAQQGIRFDALDPRVARVVTLLRGYASARFSLDQAAEVAGLSPSYFSRLFEQEMGKSFRAFMVHARLDRARILLEETDLPVGTIAQVLGYEHAYLFSRQFHQHFGHPPRQVRRTK
jgi:AraC-like DNA-binding protein